MTADPCPTALAAFAACTLCLPALAQQADAPQRVEIVSGAPLPGLDLRREQVAAPVQSATGEEIERSGALGLADFANRRLGSVFVNEMQGNPFQPDVSYRGFTASPLLGTPQGLSVYLDGVRLNQPFGDVVSWDLIPRSAIAELTLMPGSNPLFGLNTLGGALSVQTKDGLSHPGVALQASGGSFGRRTGEFEWGGAGAGGLDWFATGQSYREDGWRDDSPSDLRQLFGKLGWHSATTRVTLAGAWADTTLNGNALQEQRFLARDRASVYTKPDQTQNRSTLVNLAATHALDATRSLSGNAYVRRIDSRSFNGDVNEASLDQSIYTLTAADKQALDAAGILYPATPITPGNTPFPSLRCIAQALQQDEPGLNCNALLNSGSTDQRNEGFAGQFSWRLAGAGTTHQLMLGAAWDQSRVDYAQTQQLGFLNPDRSVTGVDAFADGASGGTVDGEPLDNRVTLQSRTRTWSVFGADTVSFGNTLFLTLSGRYNQVKVENRDQIVSAPDPASLDGNHRFSRFNPAVGLVWSAAPGFQTYAGYNEGSRAPTAIELGCANPDRPCKLPNAMAGDPPLQQVVTRTLEAGLRGALAGGGSWRAGVFRAENRDDLLFVASPSANGYGYFKNFGKTRRQGLELGADSKLGPAKLSLAYTWLDVTYQSEETLSGAGNSRNDAGSGLDGNIQVHPGDRVPLVPRQMIKAGAAFDFGERWSLDLDVVGVAGSNARGNENGQHQPDGTYYLGPGRSGGYALAHLGGAYRPAKGLKLFAQVSNLFDRHYATASQLGVTAFDGNGHFQAQPFPALADGTRSLQYATFYAPAAPRAVVFGVRWEFE